MPESPNDRPGPPRGFVVLGTFAAATIVAAGLHAAADIVGPVFLALVLTIVVHPVRRRIERHLPDWAAALASIVVVYALLLALTLAVLVSLGRFATLLPTYSEEFTRTIGELRARLADAGIGSEQIQDLVAGLDLSRLTAFVESLLGGFVDTLSSLVLVFAVLLFLAMDASTFPLLLRRAGQVRPAFVAGLASFTAGTRRYLVVSTVFGVAIAVVETVALAVIGVPVPLLWGLLALVTTYIPNVGFLLAMLPPATLALLEGGWDQCLAVVIVYGVIGVVVQNVVQPRTVGDAIGLSTTLIFLSLVLWTWILGPLGALLAVPLTLLARAVLVDVDPRSRWLRALLANRPVRRRAPPPPPPAPSGPPRASRVVSPPRPR